MSEEEKRYYEKWETVIDWRMNDIYNSITAPEFLTIEDNKIRFIEEITKFLRKQSKKYKNNKIGKNLCVGDVYGIIIPLQKHFNNEIEQTFISRITNTYSMDEAISRIKRRNWQYYQEVTVTTRQSTPNSAARNYDGCGVGKGLKISGTLQYICLSCNKFVGFTEDDYWEHQTIVHDNPRVRTITTTKLMNRFRF